MSDKHTATPWTKSALATLYLVPEGGSDPICSMGEYNEDGTIDGVFENAEANAEFIVTACNHHDALVAACQQVSAAATEDVQINLKAIHYAILQVRAALAALAEKPLPDKDGA